MTVKKVWAVYFSGTGTTKKTVDRIAHRLAEALGTDCEVYDYTLPAARRQELLFGNRNYDDALMELSRLLTADGFSCVAGGAFVGEHSFSRTLGAGRPSGADVGEMDAFAEHVAAKLVAGDAAPVTVGGCDPIRPYYTPRDRHGEPINILKVKPKTDMTKCGGCGLCAARCPMGSIDPADVSRVNGVCIKCGACVKGCPSGAKYFDDPGYLYHKSELEELYARPAKNEVFL